MPVADCGVRSLGSTRRRANAAGRQYLQTPDADKQLASSASGIEASSSMPVAKLGGSN
jgi:hypothetical protein